ncbi:MAG: hypothetical protein WC088_04445 [Candidatus Izemoplasmatales bacterium]
MKYAKVQIPFGNEKKIKKNGFWRIVQTKYIRWASDEPQIT